MIRAIEDQLAAAKRSVMELPNSRERAMVLTKLDEAELWMGTMSVPVSDPLPEAYGVEQN